MPTVYGMIGEPDPKRAPRFRLRVNGRWIDIQLAEALLIHEILEGWIQAGHRGDRAGPQHRREPGCRRPRPCGEEASRRAGGRLGRRDPDRAAEPPVGLTGAEPWPCADALAASALHGPAATAP